jgi:hypothetical protein
MYKLVPLQNCAWREKNLAGLESLFEHIISSSGKVSEIISTRQRLEILEGRQILRKPIRPAVQ